MMEYYIVKYKSTYVYQVIKNVVSDSGEVTKTVDYEGSLSDCYAFIYFTKNNMLRY